MGRNHCLWLRKFYSRPCIFTLQEVKCRRSVYRLVVRLSVEPRELQTIGVGGNGMTRTRALASIGAVLAVAAFLPASAQQAQTQQNAPSASASALQDTLQIYCLGCHSGPTP